MQIINFVQNHRELAFIVIALWTLPWKGVALWKSAGKKQIGWFIALMILNTLGILEILYIFVFSRLKKSPEKVSA